MRSPVAELRDGARRAVRARGDHTDARHRRQVADQRRHRHVVEQRLPDLRRRRCSGSERLAREAVLADELGRLLGVSAAWARAKPSTRRGRPSSRRRGRSTRTGARCSSETSSVGLPAVTRPRRVGQTQQVAVRHALALAVLDRLERERVDGLRGVPAADRAPQRRGPSRGSPRRTRRTGTGACRSAPPAAAPRARPCGSARRRRLPPARARTGPGRSSAHGPPSRCGRSPRPRAGRPRGPQPRPRPRSRA